MSPSITLRASAFSIFVLSGMQLFSSKPDEEEEGRPCRSLDLWVPYFLRSPERLNERERQCQHEQAVRIGTEAMVRQTRKAAMGLRLSPLNVVDQASPATGF
ncbi:MAG: hypothetical protein R6U51_08175 [Anaerolineales bacterium]